MKLSTLSSFLLASLCITASIQAETMQGTVEERGMGKFKFKPASGDTVVIYLSKKVDTTFDPFMWRPDAGDEVELVCKETPHRDTTILVAEQVKRLKSGPNTFDLVSPVTGTIIEVGRSGYIVTMNDYNDKKQKFTKQRWTKVIPKDWKPKSGDTALISFEAKVPRFGFGIGYYVSEIKQVQ